MASMSSTTSDHAFTGAWTPDGQTIVTVAISYLHLPVAMAVTVALLVAIVKGSLVACYFMHLISEKKLIYAVLILTGVFFVALLALPVLTHSNGFWIPQ